MSDTTATLFINRSDSRCGACGRSAYPHDDRHETPTGWTPEPGCGAEFIAVASDYFGLDEAVKQMRPDLPFIAPADAMGADA